MPVKVLVHKSDGIRNCKTNRFKEAVRRIAEDYGWQDGQISIAIVTDPEIHLLNKQHLQHDYPTDVLSFNLSDCDEIVEGEIVASIETADRECSEHGWSGDDELMLYIIHGMLHIAGLDDKTPEDAEEMWAVQEEYVQLAKCL